MPKISNLQARQILDSRGNPTVEVDLTLDSGLLARSSVPSGASTGSREALELRDKKENFYFGKSVLKSVNFINDLIFQKLKNMDVRQQSHIDETLINLDGTENKSNLGANTILAVSMAVAKAAASFEKKPLFLYLFENLKVPNLNNTLVLPAPLMNIINGGQHASNNLDIQEFMIVPHLKDSFSNNLRAGVEIFHTLKKVLSEKNILQMLEMKGDLPPTFTLTKKLLNLYYKQLKELVILQEKMSLFL